MDVVASVAAGGGVAYVRDLRRGGALVEDVRRSVADGGLSRLRRGLVAIPGLAPDVRRAARVGGRLAGASAARELGLWAPRTSLTVAVPEHSGRLWHPDLPSTPLGDAGVTLLRGGPEGPRFGVSNVLLTLAEAAVTLPAPQAIAVGDSALRRSRTTLAALRGLDDWLPPRATGILTRCDGRADSGSESIARILLQDAGLRPRPQAKIPLTDHERVDLLVGDRLVIECDSEEHHGSPDARRRDLRRDARMSALGMIVLRFDYGQILHEPDAVLASVLRYVDLGLHLF